ncbi:radical SAM protein [Cetobacterium sp.]|uniref:radical SAM protein n=1 Tax=Cetobacterium sp. TaxID=2071632 RepID=UPI003F351A24
MNNQLFKISSMKEKALYLNFPFCIKSCSYCHYRENIKFGYKRIPNEYIDILLLQLKNIVKDNVSLEFESIYFGGGTASLLNNEQLDKIFSFFKSIKLSSKEVSIELHPYYINFNLENDYFNRYSIGVQFFEKDSFKNANRDYYSIDELNKIILKIKNKNIKNKISIDIIFKEVLEKESLKNILLLQPDTVYFYPDTQYQDKKKLKRITETLENIDLCLKGYKRLENSKFIFVKEGESISKYSELEYGKMGDIIGIGDNSVSHIGNKSILSCYDNNKVKYKIKNYERYIDYLIMSINVGIKEDYINFFDFDLRPLLKKSENTYFLPDHEYVYFAELLKKYYGDEKVKLFTSTIGYGLKNVEEILLYYNNKMFGSEYNELETYLKSKNLKKLELPNMNILIEGIDGSGKDTFAKLLIEELKKRFKFYKKKTISIMGEPNSKLKYGRLAKRIIEDYDIDLPLEMIEDVLTKNREESEKIRDEIEGIKILVRGVVTDIGTFKIKNNQFPKSDLGFKSYIDKFIVIDIDPQIADFRIEERGISRTWREEYKYLKEFRKFYLEYTNKNFKEKLVIENKTMIGLKNKAKEIADKIYIEKFLEEKKAITLMLKIVGNSCNLKCEYCYENRNISYNNIFSLNEIKTKLEQFKNYKNIFLIFHGGEPLLTPKNLFKEIMEYITKEFLGKLNIQIQTNGTLIDEEWIEIFKNYKKILSISISLDPAGEKDLRKIKDRENIFLNLERLQKELSNIGIISVAHQYNKDDFINFIEYLQLINIKSLTINKYRLVENQANIGITESQYNKLLEQILEYWIKSESYKKIRIQPLISLLSKENKLCLYLNDKNKCKQFRTFYPGEESIIYCDHYKEEEIDIIQEKKCVECSIYSFCGGGCRMEKKDENYCNARKRMYKYIGRLKNANNKF